MRIYNPTITGSLTLSGSLVATQTLDVTVTTASYAITASHALNATAESSSFATTASYSISSSHAEFSDSSTTSTSASFATTSSHSEFADQAGTSTSASFSTTASHAEFSDESGTSTSSSYATTASHAEFSDEASTAASSTSASYATTSSFAISSSHSEFADDAASATSSSYALTASFALNAGGGSGVTETIEYNGQIRYEIVSGSTKAQIVSTGNVYKNLTWSRSSTTLTVTSTSHGLSSGDLVLIRNMSEDYELKSITSTGANSFTCTVADSGGTSGTSGAYIPAFGCSTVDLTTGVVTVTAPGAGDLQINSMMVYAPSSEADPITVNIPAGDSNSGGINSALDTRFIPLCTFYKLDGVSPVLSTTTATAYSKTANFAQYTITGGSPDTFGAVQFMLRF